MLLTQAAHAQHVGDLRQLLRCVLRYCCLSSLSQFSTLLMSTDAARRHGGTHQLLVLATA